MNEESRVQQLQMDVVEVTGAMEENYDRLIERGINLEDLDERSDALRESSRQFRKTSTKLKEKKETENMSCKKWKWIAIGGGILFVFILPAIIVYSTWPSEKR